MITGSTDVASLSLSSIMSTVEWLILLWCFASGLSERLFRSTLNNPRHTLHALLPPQSTTSQNYGLKQRVHDRQLPVHLGHLIDKNFITRSLYKDMYWLLLAYFWNLVLRN